MLAVLGAVDGADAVERDGEFRTFGDDLVDVPLPAGLRHRRHLGHVDDRAGAVARVGALVEDVDLVAVLGGDLFGIGAANEDAAVGVGIDPELGPDFEIRIGILRDQEAVALVGLHDAVGKRPIGVADLCPVVEALAVEQRDPSGVALTGGLVPETREPHDEQCRGEPAFHLIPPALLNIESLPRVRITLRSCALLRAGSSPESTRVANRRLPLQPPATRRGPRSTRIRDGAPLAPARNDRDIGAGGIAGRWRLSHAAYSWNVIRCRMGGFRRLSLGAARRAGQCSARKPAAACVCQPRLLWGAEYAELQCRVLERMRPSRV